MHSIIDYILFKLNKKSNGVNKAMILLAIAASAVVVEK